MPYRISKTIEVQNGHMLSKHPDHCKFPHGHSRKIEFVLEADCLDDNDMVCDFKVVKNVIRDYIMCYDHALCVNTNDPHYPVMKKEFGEKIIDFEGTDPTTEVIAKTIFDAFKKKLEDYKQEDNPRYPLRPSVRILQVRVYETSDAWAEFSE